VSSVEHNCPARIGGRNADLECAPPSRNIMAAGGLLSTKAETKRVRAISQTESAF